MKKPDEPSFWELLQTRGAAVTPGEDLADSIALIIIMALVCFVIFI
jgi:hypothetical protein